MNDYPGTFITIEGIDGAGKTTACDAISNRFPNVLVTQSPTDEWTGKLVREALSGERDLPPLVVFYLFVADMAYHTEAIIEPALDAGKTVVSDRYLDSTIAYQSNEIDTYLDEPESVWSWIKQVASAWYIEPDLTIYLDLPVEVAVKRMEGDEIFENANTQRQVRKMYKVMHPHQTRFEVLSGAQPVKSMNADVIEAIQEVLDDG